MPIIKHISGIDEDVILSPGRIDFVISKRKAFDEAKCACCPTPPVIFDRGIPLCQKHWDKQSSLREQQVKELWTTQGRVQPGDIFRYSSPGKIMEWQGALFSGNDRILVLERRKDTLITSCPMNQVESLTFTDNQLIALLRDGTFKKEETYVKREKRRQRKSSPV